MLMFQQIAQLNKYAAIILKLLLLAIIVGLLDKIQFGQ